MTVTVMSKPNCTQCTATKRALTSKGVVYEEVDLTEDEEAYALALELGHRSAPVVVAGDQHWSGFRIDKISELAARVA